METVHRPTDEHSHWNLSGDKAAKECIQMVLEAKAVNGFRITTFEEPLNYNAWEGTGMTTELDDDFDERTFSNRPRRAPFPRKTPDQRRKEMRDAAAEPYRSSQFSHHSRSYDNIA